MFFLYGRSYEKDTLLDDKETDSKDQILLREDDAFLQESEYGSPLENISHQNSTEELSVVTERNKVSSIINNIQNEENSNDENYYIPEESANNDTKKEDFTEQEKPFAAENPNFKLEQVHQEKETFGGSLTGESTSKSSIEWRSSTIFRDSETEYPFSSSSRRSSSNWEFYTLFKKYDEEMFFFDRFSAQKLAETGNNLSL